MAESMNLSTFKRIEITPSVIDKYSMKVARLKKLPIKNHKGFLWVDADDKVVAFVNVFTVIPHKKIQSLYLDAKHKGEGLYLQLIKFATQTLQANEVSVNTNDKKTMQTLINMGFKELTRSNNFAVMTKAPIPKKKKDGNYRPVYVVLTHVKQPMNIFVKTMTGALYSHASISFDSALNEVYSFASRGKSHTLVPLGLAEESLLKYLQSDKDAKFALYVMFVPTDDYNTMKSKVKNYKEHKADYSYDVSGVVKNFFNMKSMNDKNKFCSGFVAEILNSGKTRVTHKDSDMMRPDDISDILNIHFVDAGLVRNYDKKEIDERVKKIFEKHYAASKKKETKEE